MDNQQAEPTNGALSKDIGIPLRDETLTQGKIAFRLFFAFFFFYFLGLGGHIYTPDGTIIYLVTKNIVAEGRTDIQQLRQWPSFGGREITDPASGRKKFFSKYGIGLSLAAIPFFAAGKALLGFTSNREKDIFDVSGIRMVFPDKSGKDVSMTLRGLYYDADRENFEDAFLAFSVTWTNPAIVSGIITGIFCICTTLGFSTFSSFLLAVFCGLCSPLWHYSKEFFSEPLSAFGLIWFFYFALRESRKNDPGYGWFLAGFFLGVTILAKIASSVAIIPCGFLTVAYLMRLPFRKAIRGAVLFSAGFGLCMILLFSYNYSRFGSILETGYGDEALLWDSPFFGGLHGILLSPGRGLLIYSPILFLSLAGLFSFGRSFPLEAIFISMSHLAFLCLYSKWFSWEGGWCWGPRFVFPMLPLSLIPFVSIIAKPPARSILRIVILLVLVLSFITAVNGVIVSYNDYYNWLQKLYLSNAKQFAKEGVTSDYDLLRWDWFYSPILNYWDFPVKDYFLLPRAIANPGAILLLFFAAFAGLALSLLGLWNNLRSESPKEPLF